MIRRLILALASVVILIPIAITLHHIDNDPPAPQLHEWEEMNVWPLADRQFPSNPAEPLLLYKDDQLNKSIYIQDGLIRSHSLEADKVKESTLLNIEVPEGYYWRSGETLLIGLPIDQSNPDNYMRGEWYAIDIGDSADVQPSILKLEDAFIDPGKLLTVTIVEDAELFLLVDDNDGVRFNEYFYATGESRLQYVNLDIPRNDDKYYEAYIRDHRPLAVEEVQYFQLITPYPLADGTSIHGYEDDRGTLLVYQSIADHIHYAIRYAGVKLVDVVLKTDILGNNYPLIWTDGTIDAMSFATMGNSTSLEPTEELLKDEWRMINMRHYYRLAGDSLETIRYEVSQGVHYSEPERRTYELPGHPVDDQHGLLTFDMNGVTRYLSVFDLIHGRGYLNELWIQDLPTDLNSSIGERAIAEWDILNEIALPAEIVERQWKTEELPIEVTYAADPSNSECILSCHGDFYNVPQIRSIEGIWYGLTGESLYQVEDAKWSFIGMLPVSTAFTHGEGSNGYTALDYTRIGTDWYVADTYGDRVIKLGDKLKIIAEYPLPSPSQIVVKNNYFHVKSLNGITKLDTNLKWINETDDVPVKIQSMKPSEQLFAEISHYIDEELGTHWVYVGGGNLIIYKPASKQYTTTFIGNPQSGRSIVRIIPYQDEILVLSDYQLLRFYPDGQRKSTIDFTRGPSDGIYNQTPDGENSYALDLANNRIYVVQGVRIVAIDLANDIAYPLFQQDYSNIGELSLYKDRLLFTMEGNPYYSPEESTENSNELIVIHQGSSVYRYRIESGWNSEGLDTQSHQLNLWSFQDSNNRAWDQINRGMISLDRLIFPYTESNITSINLKQQGLNQWH